MDCPRSTERTRATGKRCQGLPSESPKRPPEGSQQVGSRQHNSWSRNAVWWASPTTEQHSLSPILQLNKRTKPCHRSVVDGRHQQGLHQTREGKDDASHLRSTKIIGRIENRDRPPSTQQIPPRPALQASDNHGSRSSSIPPRILHQDRHNGRIPSRRVQQASPRMDGFHLERQDLQVSRHGLRESLISMAPITDHGSSNQNIETSRSDTTDLRGRHINNVTNKSQMHKGHEEGIQTPDLTRMEHQLQQERSDPNPIDRISRVHPGYNGQSEDRHPQEETKGNQPRGGTNEPGFIHTPQVSSQSTGIDLIHLQSDTPSPSIHETTFDRAAEGSHEEQRLETHVHLVSPIETGPGGSNQPNTVSTSQNHRPSDRGRDQDRCLPDRHGRCPSETIGENALPHTGIYGNPDEAEPAYKRPRTQGSSRCDKEMGTTASGQDRSPEDGQHSCLVLCDETLRQDPYPTEVGDALDEAMYPQQNHSMPTIHNISTEFLGRQPIEDVREASDRASTSEGNGGSRPGSSTIPEHSIHCEGTNHDEALTRCYSNSTMEVSSVVADAQQRGDRDEAGPSTAYCGKSTCAGCQVWRHGTVELLFQKVLGVDANTRSLILADRTANQLKNAYDLLRSHVQGGSQPHGLIFHPANMAAILDKATRSGQTARPETITAAFRRMLNWLWILFQDQKSLLAKISKEIIKTRTLTPKKKGKPTVDVKKLLECVASYPISSYLDLRNKVILLYRLASGRRPSNAARAMTPMREDVFPNLAIAFTEFRTKNDGSRVGNLNFIPAASVPEIDPVRCFITLFTSKQNFRLLIGSLPVNFFWLFFFRGNNQKKNTGKIGWF